MNFKNKLLVISSLLLFILPLNVLAYSKYIIPGGETVGIEVNSKGVLVVGFYKVDESYIAKEIGFEIGDKIIKINDTAINNINEMVSIINKSAPNIKFSIIRGGKNENITFNLIKDKDEIYKTGLYVKDTITGIGTLTYIDPESNIFGALGHEIIEHQTGEKFEIKDGIIFKSVIDSIDRSSTNSAGSKNATYDKSNVYGNITSNETSGVFGNYNKSLPTDKALEVAAPKEGNAVIRTVIKDEKTEEFTINILKVEENSKTKNILFQITDNNLIEKTGGVVQGMSGSPIIQDNKLVGAVTHVIVNDSTKGYGILITTMLKEGDTEKSG